MEMQDKEFDSLFSSKLGDLEIEPSKAVWQGIAGELGGDRRRRIIPFLSIAASIVILIAAGILFISRDVKTVKPQPVKGRLANNRSVKVAPALAVQQQAAIAPKVITSAVSQAVVLHQPKKNNKILTVSNPNIVPEKTEPANINEQPVLAAVQQKQDIIKPDSSASRPVLAATTIAQAPANPGVIADVPETGKPANTPRVRKHRIPSFGEMLNVVIAAVDKRKDKIIEFSDTDGDESSITGINLGIIKIKKEN